MMDENTWRCVQVMMWLMGLQTAFLTAILGIMWAKICKIDDKLTDVDKRVFAIKITDYEEIIQILSTDPDS